MLASELLIQALEQAGVEVVFGIPGAQVLSLYDALSRSTRLRHILVRHEQAAAHAADGYARASGRVGVVLATSGPGATNTVTGVATAYMDSVPMVVICGQVPTTAIGTDAFQEADITTITLPITKHSYLVKDAALLQEIVEEAFYIAASGRPGPVLIDIPANIQATKVAARPARSCVRLASYRPTLKGNARQCRQAAELIRATARPLILAGGGVISSNAGKQLRELAELIAAPVANTLMAKAAFSPDSLLALGLVGMHGSPLTNNAVQESDLIIALGTRFSDRVTGDASRFAPQAKIIHIDIDPAEIGKNLRVDVPIVGDLATVLSSLLELLGDFQSPLREGWPPTQVAASSPQPSPSASLATETTWISPSEVFFALNHIAQGREMVYTTDVGQHQMWAAQLLQTSTERGFLSSGGLGTMGFGLPAALGAQIARPEACVLCISGDGSLQMNSQEMATAAINGLPLKVIVFDNRALGLVRQWQHFYYHDNYAHTALDAIPDFCSLAKAYHWQARTYQHHGDDATGITEALKWLLAQEGPALLNIPISRDELVLPMLARGGSLAEEVKHV
ncbi:MAG: biosynthetic-type acetolactate synthase large subunit [Coriobacteriales bacterium]|nr:biosynthetic-type acetolactate synthase large subunit [Coriobacteriales bacterium]